MPFLSYGGPVGTPAAQIRLAHHARDEAARSGVDLLELRSRERIEAGLNLSHRKVTVLLELPHTTEELWQRFPSKLRSQIRRPLKDHMEVRFGLDQREAFYEDFAQY